VDVAAEKAETIAGAAETVVVRLKPSDGHHARDRHEQSRSADRCDADVPRQNVSVVAKRLEDKSRSSAVALE
jgi:hypothetical protein